MVSLRDLLLVLLQIAPAVIISAGANFGIAYAMYHTQHSINFFPFPNTIAGDLAVTNFIQGVLNYIFPSITLELDNRLGKRLPWRGLWTPSLSLVKRIASLKGRKKQFWNTFLQSQDLTAQPLTTKTFFKRLFFCILRGLFLSVFLFLLTWSLSVAIACPIYCGKNIGPLWAPQAIKGIYGGVHALIEIPLASFLVLLGIDVRNETRSTSSPANKTDPHQRSPNDLSNSSAPSSANSNVGLVTDVETGRVISIDTRTNTPLVGGSDRAV